ncbi:MAG: acyl-CoA dehydrogenase family protein, partial [Pseudomonadota bacterium]|nr:acyl-CoA dehydrogenase family protein [Pseudomonadota bacterium]
MNFDFNEEQTMIMDGIARYIREEYDFDRRRSIIESDSAYSDDVWRQFSELGWLSIPFDESYGGFGGHADDLAGVMLELGKGLIIEPYMSTVVVFGSLLNASNNDSLKEQLIPRIINGQYKGSFAYAEEQSRFEISDVKTSAQKCGDGYKLNGTKIAVIDAKESDGLIVTARTGGSQYGAEGISLFLVDTSAEGVAVSSYNTMDSHSSSTINLENVFVTEANLIVHEGEGFRHI